MNELSVSKINEISNNQASLNPIKIELYDNENENENLPLNKKILERIKKDWNMLENEESKNNTENSQIFNENEKSNNGLLEDQKMGISSFAVLKELGSGSFGKVFLVKIINYIFLY